MTRPYRVLIADDEKPVAVGLQNQLESLGYDVVAVVNDGQRAIEMCRRTLPDVVFMDIEMPGLDGLSAARQIAVDPGYARHHPDRPWPSQPDRPGRRGRCDLLPAQAGDQSEPARGRAGGGGPGPRAQGAAGRRRPAEIDAPRAQADRTGQGHPDVAPASQRERGVPALQRQSQDRRIPMAKLAESIIQTDELLEAPNQAGAMAGCGRFAAIRELPHGE